MRLRAPRVCPATQRPAQSSFPSGGSSIACRRTLRVDPETHCLPWSSVLPGVLSADELRGRWVPRSRCGLGFSPGPSRCLRPPSTPPFDRVSSSFELAVSFGVLRPACRPSRSDRTSRPDRTAEERLPWGPVPSSRRQQAASTTPQGIPTQRSRSVLDGFLRHLPVRACFIPLPRPGFALQGFVPRRGAVPGFPGRFMPSWR